VNTEIRYLQHVEQDLKEAAGRQVEIRRAAERARHAKTRARSRRWQYVAAVVVPILLVAGAIGGIATLSNTSNESASGGAASESRAGQDRLADVGFGYYVDPGIAPGAGPSPAGGDGGGGALGGSRNGLGTSAGDLSKIIRNGEIGVVVANDGFGRAVDRVGRVARANGGFVLSSRIQGNQRGTLVLRIPASRFDQAMETLRGIGTAVEFETITGEDVTAEFVDLTARARILSVRRTVLIGLQADATALEETLRLQGQLDDVQLKIEQIQGQIRFINDQVAEATLRVSLREQDAEAADPDTDVDKPSLGHSFELGIKGFLNVVGFVIVGLGYLVPVGVVLGAMWAVWYLARRSRGRDAGGE
jgi:uncharacterized protein DUF4349